jgi:hypothetical protein
VGCRPTSGDANGAGNNKKNKVGITPDCFPRKEDTAGEAAYWDAQENRRIQTSAEKQKKLSLAAQNRRSIIPLCRAIAD